MGPARGARRLPRRGAGSSRSTTATGWPSPRPGPRPRSRWPATSGPTSSTRRSTSPGCSHHGRRRRSPTWSRGTLDAVGLVGAAPTWVLSNHDVVRHPTRYGGGARGLARARAATLTMLALPGSAYLYQGEELGLEEVDVPPELRQDPAWLRTGLPGRDGARVPIPWRGTRSPYGFGPAGRRPWLPMPDDWADLTVAAQRQDPASTWSFYRHALTARRRIAAQRADGRDRRGPLDGARPAARRPEGPVQLRVAAGADARRAGRGRERTARTATCCRRTRRSGSGDRKGASGVLVEGAVVASETGDEVAQVVLGPLAELLVQPAPAVAVDRLQPVYGVRAGRDQGRPAVDRVGLAHRADRGRTGAAPAG